MYGVILATRYQSSLKRILRHKDFKLAKPEQMVDTLAARGKLESKYHDHALGGEMAGFRECHLAGNILLIYQILEKARVIILVNIGSHPDLFKWP